MISRYLIEDGIKAKVIQFIPDPNMDSGTVCKIGDSWFYFGGITAEENSPKDYLENVPIEDIVDDIYDVLREFKEDDDCVDEYEYYKYILTNRNNI